jgi:hypothetical protein
LYVDSVVTIILLADFDFLQVKPASLSDGVVQY